MGIRAYMRWVMVLLLWTLGLVTAQPAAATAFPLATCLVRAAPGMTAPALFKAPERFDCTTSQRRFGPGDFWVLSQPLPAAQLRGTSARIGSIWMTRITLYVRYADGAIRHVGVTPKTAHEILNLGAVLSQPLPRHDAPPVRLLWHVEGATNLRGVILQPVLADHGEAATTEIVRGALYGAFAGMAIALIVYNLALWGALRQAFQPVYCLLVLCLLAYVSTSSGAAGQVFTGLDNNDRQRLNILFLAASASTALLFARSFFERAVFSGWVRPLSSAVMVGLVGMAGLWVMLAPRAIHVLDTCMSIAYLGFIGVVAIILWRAWRVRSNYLWLFALAWGAPIVMSGLRIASSFGMVEPSLLVDNSTVIAMAIEALLSSTAIAYRILLLSRERDAAREQEIAARLLADTDPLTGLLNRRAFLARAIGRPGEQTLLIADIDHFKRVNETIGHDGGDEVLRAFARALRSALPTDTLIARIGGEEFAILVDASTSVSPCAIRDRVRGQSMPYDITVTASIGTCTGPLLHDADWKTLYRDADRALFEAKAAGRDRSRSAVSLVSAA
jgi:diguanylate cyclase (GGDEF)-like protein